MNILMGMMDNMKMKMDEMTSKQMVNMLEEKSGPEFNQMFLEHMIHHHETGVEMAKLATKKSSRSEIQEMAQKMVDDQTEEIEQMRQMQ